MLKRDYLSTKCILVGALLTMPLFLILIIGDSTYWSHRVTRANTLPITCKDLNAKELSPNSSVQLAKEAAARIIYRPVKMSPHRQQLIREYTLIHYGVSMETIIPRAIVLHWTAVEGIENVFQYFYNEESPDYSDPEYGLLNVTSHYLVDRDGTIYQLTPETMLNRHAIGLNWCSIGIENIGGVDGREDLTPEQLKANLFLIKYLQSKYPEIHYVLGHYQQDRAGNVGLWKEQIKEYYAVKDDPGSLFMKKVADALQGTGIVTFDP